MQLHKRESGIALVVTLWLISILLIVSAVIVQTTTHSFRFGTAQKLKFRAFYASEAGASHILGHYYNNPADFSSKQSAANMGFATSSPSQATFGQDLAYWIFSIIYDSATPPAWVEIESHGTVIGTGTDQGILSRWGVQHDSPFRFGAFGNYGVTLSGQGYVDSYNSNNGPWSFVTHRTNGNTGTNSTSEGAITLGGQAKVYGSAQVGPGGNPETAISISGQADILGSKTAATQLKDMTPKSDPGGGTPLTIHNGDIIGSGQYRVSSLKLSGQSVVRIAGAVTMYISGDFQMSGQSEIIIEPTASLTLYVSGSFDMSGQGIINQANKPANLLVYGTSTCTSVKLSGQADFYGGVYAPMALGHFTGQADIFGSVITDTFFASGQGSIHFDENLLNLGPVTKFKLISWKWL